MGKTLVALYENPAIGQRVLTDLAAVGFSPEEYRSVNPGDFQETPPLETDVLGIAGLAKPAVGEYEEAVRRGCSLVAVTVPEKTAVTAYNTLARHHPLDLDVKVEQWKVSGWKNPYDARRKDSDHRSELLEKRETVQTGRERSEAGVRVFVW